MPGELIAATALGSIAEKVAEEGFATLLSELIKLAFRPSERGDDGLFAAKRFETHFQSTFDRCTMVKTLVSRDEPISLLEHYVSVRFSHVEGGQPQVQDDYALIKTLRLKNVLSFLEQRGGGKTVFMKYLWISFFVNPEGSIPVFLELRRLNDIHP